MKIEDTHKISSLEKTVIDNIRKIRHEKGISQLRLSIFCGTSASYIGLMETYKNIPKLSTIERIAEALHVPVLKIFEENENNNISSGKTDIKSKREEVKKQKIRKHLKEESLSRLGNDLDDLLEII